MIKAIAKKSKDKVVSWGTHLDKKYVLHGISIRSEFEIKSQTSFISLKNVTQVFFIFPQGSKN